MKKYINYIIFIVVFNIIGLMWILYNTQISSIYSDTHLLKITEPKKIKKPECNTTYFNKPYKWLKSTALPVKVVKKIKKIIIHKNIYVKNKTIYVKNKKYTYIADINEKQLFAVFKSVQNNHTLFFNVAKNKKLDDTNLTLITNNKHKLIFKDINKTYTINKNFIDIKKYQKDTNETNKSKK